MANTPHIRNFEKYFSEEQFNTQTEMLEIQNKSQRLLIGIPKETILVEKRVALVPNNVRVLIAHGHRVIVESGAGKEANFSDADYSEAGAEISSSRNTVFECDIILKIQPPSLDEIDLMKVNKTLLSSLSLPLINLEYLQKLQQKRVTAIALDYLKDDTNSKPLKRMHSEISGQLAVLKAAELLTSSQNGRGVLLGNVTGIPPVKVVILGAGTKGEFATRQALAMGASVRVFDNSIQKLATLKDKFNGELHTSTFNPVYLGYQLLSADVVIGAEESDKRRAPILITEEMVSSMKSGAVIIDLSIDQGGCIETSKITTLKNPTYTRHGVTHYCVPNIASDVSRTASIVFSIILSSELLKWSKSPSFAKHVCKNSGVRDALYMYKGKATDAYLCSLYGLKYTNLNLVLTSDL